MAITALTDARIYVNEYDLASDVNNVEVGVEVAEIDVTNFDSGGWTEVIGGLKSGMVTMSGFFDLAAGKSEEALEASLGSTGQVITVTADDAVGSTALFGSAFHGKLSRLGGVGEAAPLSGDFKSSTPYGLVEGELMVAKATQNAGDSSDVQQLGAVSATQRIYVALHVFEVTGGGSLAVIAESDDNSDMTSATTRVSMTAATGATAEFKSAAGAITDDYWRITWTLSAGTATFAVVAGIQ